MDGFSTVLAASSPLLANASVGRRGGMGMEPAYPEVPATHLCDNHGIRPVQVGRAREWVTLGVLHACEVGVGTGRRAL